LLGELYFETKRYPEATDAFVRADERLPVHPLSIKNQRSDVFDCRYLARLPGCGSSPAISSWHRISTTRPACVFPITNVIPGIRHLAVPFLPNFHDPTRPTFDTEGRALESLKSIWLNDPTSDLADDALMMTASHYLRKGDSVRADEYFAALRQNYPDSPHFKNSFILGSHVKLMSYEGTSYDGARLDEAEQLKESALRMWPDSDHAWPLEAGTAGHRRGESQARMGPRGILRQEGSRTDSAAIYCREILRLYPDTKYAQSARQYLQYQSSSSDPQRSKAGCPQLELELVPTAGKCA
jgi:tetratricopeptide (TPR) repeat protein